MQIDTYKKREENRVGDSTLKSRLSVLRRFDQFVDGGEPTVEDVEDWIDHLIDLHNDNQIKASTIRQYLKSIDYYFETVKGEYDKLEHIKRRLPEQDIDHGEYLTEEEWENFRNGIYNRRDRVIIELMYWYARRPGEIRLLNKEDVDLEEETITFNILKKKKDDRGEPLPYLNLKGSPDGGVYERHRVFRATFELIDEVKPHLERYLTSSPNRTEMIEYDDVEMEVHPLFSGNNPRISYDTIWRMVKRETKKAGIDKNIIPKSGRHSRATHLNWAGHSPEQIADQQLVHDPETNVVGAYVHPRDEDDVREVMGTEESEK